jgi:beta-lactam-binding protein with PASTA domain
MDSEKKDKKKVKIDLKKLRVNVSETYDKVQSNVPLYICVCVAAFLIVVMAAVATFFATVKGPEQVLVPNVVGKQLEDALLEMQVKELYPKINLRYSDVPGDEGAILEQSPAAGAIVKGYSRVNLVVSRGVVVDKLGNYVGQNFDDVQLSLQTLFAGQARPLIVLGTPEYKPDLAEAGTILEQDPPEGTEISEPVTVTLVVSRGPNYENTRAPYVIGQTVNDLLQTIARSKIVFDITSHVASDDEKEGTVVNQQTFDSEFVPNYTRVALEMALPKKQDNDNVQGIFTQTVANYPYPVPMKLVAVPTEGDSYTILNFAHPGGLVTIPYSVPKNTTLVLYVVDKENSKMQVK